MKKIITIALLVVLMTGCSGRPAPDWTLKSFNRLEEFKKQYLEGNVRMADLHFNRALDEIKKSGNLDLLSRAHLIHMAMEAAVLENIRDEAYLQIDAIAPDPALRTFHAFLTGQMKNIQEQGLPEQYRRVFRQLIADNPGSLAGEINKIADPFSRIIAIGICFREGRVNEELLNTGIETASQNGWKKALLVYLNKLQDYYRDHHQPDQADAVARRIQLITR